MGGGTQIELQTKKMNGLKLADDGDPPPPSPEDRLSSLPDKTPPTIVSFLPLKEAARTSVLSPRWRHLWTLAALDLLIAEGTTIETVSLILSRHRGPVRSFHLPASIWHPLGPNLLMVLYCWINALIQRGVQALALCYCLPPQLLACESLRSLGFMDALFFEHRLPRNLRELKLGPSVLAKGRPKLLPGLLTCELLRSLELWFYCFDYSPAEMEAMMPLPVNLR